MNFMGITGTGLMKAYQLQLTVDTGCPCLHTCYEFTFMKVNTNLQCTNGFTQLQH